MMDRERWKKVNQIVDTALDLSPHKRVSYIKQECKGDRKLKNDVTELLESIQRSAEQQFLEKPDAYPNELALDISREEPVTDLASLIGKTIGKYNILELIGHGGMGSVFLAERADGAYVKKVALKLLRQGMDTPSNIARFQQERNILATLNHPNIAQLLDGGVTENDRPYLVMEYVDGTPLLDYCDTHQLSVSQRLQIFKKICSAVEHAHRNAIIHRDLKPSNIYITNNGSVKVLDFGIAKMVEQDQTADFIIQTQTSNRILTLGYAAPEQFDNQSITTATDCYTLGILLYELLTGVHPFDLHQKNISAVQKIIRHATPTQPSQKFGTLASADQTDIATNRGESPTDLIQELRGDIDAIIMKALRAEPESRYSSVEQLLDDVNRYDRSLPLIARNDTVQYKLGKFFSRNRTSVMAICFLFVAITGFATYHINRITEERNIAKTEAQKAQTVKKVLIDIFRTSNPRSSDFQGKNLSAKELLTNSNSTINDELQSQPDVYVEILLAKGEALKNIDAYQEAESSYQKALQWSSKTSHPIKNKVKANVRLGWLYTDWNKNHEQAVEFANMAHTHLKNMKSPPPALEASVWGILGRVTSSELNDYETGNTYFEKADSIYTSAGLDHSYDYMNMLTGYGRTLLYVFDFEKSEQVLLKSNRLHRETFDRPTLTIAENYKFLGWTNRELGNFEQSNRYFRKSIVLKRKLTGDQTVQTAIPMYHLARNYKLSGDYEKSNRLAQQVLDIYQKNLKPGNQYILQAKSYVGTANYHLQNYSNAEQLYKDVINQSNHAMHKAGVKANLALVFQKTGRLQEAIDLLKESINVNKEYLGVRTRGVAVDMMKLASVYRDLGKYEQSQYYFDQAKPILDQEIAADHYRMGEFHVRHGRLKLETGNIEQARNQFSKAYEIYRDCFGETSPKTQQTQSQLEELKPI
jgi:serine/threonine-protein kinase